MIKEEGCIMAFMPILLKGEKLAESVTKGHGGGEKKLPYTYDEAKKRLVNDITDIRTSLSENKDSFLEDEVVFCVRMAEGFLAKSYRPDFIEKKDSMNFIGARIYSRKKNDDGSESKSKLYFVKGSRENLEWLLSDLNSDNFTKTEINQIRSIERLDFLSPEEKALGFDEENNEYEVEIVLHPLKQELDLALDKIKIYFKGEPLIRKYHDGPTFILSKVQRKDINNISEFNFLRTIHPLREISVPTMTRDSNIKMPNVSQQKSNKRVKVGVFDGGVNMANPFLQGSVIEHNLSSMEKTTDCVAHGNAVCGAILYSELNNYSSTDTLPLSQIEIESFRVLPEQNIYKIIDNIEQVVNTRQDIDIYNISFGPRGPILDDQINRFTFALDKLALKNKLFCVAVGNDGDVTEPFNRVQAPSDMVNGLGIGAYSHSCGKQYRSSYSCIGIGREGAKVKPDLLDFGGDERNLFQALDFDGTGRSLTAGTSFSTPLVTGKAGNLTAISKQIDPLMARCLLIHTADNIIGNGVEEGFGIVKKNINKIIECNEKKVTILYEGFIFPTRCIKLPIALPDMDNKKGKAKISWTIANLSDVDARDSDLYTNSCVEETFYPNADIYNFTKRGHKSYNKIDTKLECDLIEELYQKGYKRSKLPASDTGNYKSELERRLDMKWDTVSRKFKPKYISSLKDPFIVLQAISRDEGDTEKIKFCVAITVEIEKYEGNLYADILQKYEVLTPLEIIEETIETAVDIEI